MIERPRPSRGRGDELVTVEPLRAVIPDFAALLAGAPTIGRPLEAPEWVAALERRLGRSLSPGEPGPKPREEEDTGRELPLL
jgi:hypothetical protein